MTEEIVCRMMIKNIARIILLNFPAKLCAPDAQLALHAADLGRLARKEG